MDPPISVSKIEYVINTLRKDDVISSSLFARRCSLSIELAKKILADLVDFGILEYFIIAPCSNKIENSEHYITFDSLVEVNQYINKASKCPICNNDQSIIDFEKIKIGYRKHYPKDFANE